MIAYIYNIKSTFFREKTASCLFWDEKFIHKYMVSDFRKNIKWIGASSLELGDIYWDNIFKNDIRTTLS